MSICSAPASTEQAMSIWLAFRLQDLIQLATARLPRATLARHPASGLLDLLRPQRLTTNAGLGELDPRPQPLKSTASRSPIIPRRYNC